MLGSQTNDLYTKISLALLVRLSGTFLPTLPNPRINQGHPTHAVLPRLPSIHLSQINKVNPITLSNYAIPIHFHLLTRYKHLEGRDYETMYPLQFLFCCQNRGFKHQNLTDEIPVPKLQRF